ncbi:tetratricopeptide repeat protein [Sulfolobus acidocaldarius]|uniref:tetratricopeptide repeat protein n=1 Tax=Sulfolobus acidocaldarius TaxID=2285 RepID=UPI0007836B46|nr:tetratricopeptide repeat protein [Sulfolobus acidocaldarius]
MEEVVRAYQEGNLNYALRKINEIIKSNPSPDIYNLLGKILLELGKDEEALEAFRQANNRLEVARIYIQKGLYQDALNEIKDETNDESKILRALIYIKMENFDKAKEEIANINSNSPLFHKVKGIVEYHTANYYGALRSITIALREYPMDAELYYYRALVKAELGLEYEDDIDMAINLNPYYAELYFSKGVILEQRGKLNEAVNYYSKAIKYKPELVKAYYRRAKVYMKLGMDQEAEKDIEKVKELTLVGSEMCIRDRDKSLHYISKHYRTLFHIQASFQG